jgi:hypothetical protein
MQPNTAAPIIHAARIVIQPGTNGGCLRILDAKSASKRGNTMPNAKHKKTRIVAEFMNKGRAQPN